MLTKCDDKMPPPLRAAAATLPVPLSLRTEDCELSKIAAPIMTVSMLLFLMVMVDMAMVGTPAPVVDYDGGRRQARHGGARRQRPRQYVLQLFAGCATALDTLLGQSLGVKQYGAFGQWAKTGVLALVVCHYLWLACSSWPRRSCWRWGRTRRWQRKRASSAGSWCRASSPSSLFIGLTKYLQCQGILAPSVWIALAPNVLNAGLNWLLIYELDGGFEGAPVATSLSRWAQLLALVLYL